MTGAAPHSVPLPPEEVASAVGHALNNVLPFLYAASSFLDGEDDPPDIERARRAIDDACRSARILGAALSTLGLAGADAAGLPPFGQRIDAEASRQSQADCAASHSVSRTKTCERLALWRQSMRTSASPGA